MPETRTPEEKVLEELEQMDLEQLNKFFEKPVDFSMIYNPFDGKYRGAVISVEHDNYILTVDTYIPVASFLNKDTKKFTTVLFSYTIATKLNTIYSYVYEKLKDYYKDPQKWISDVQE